MLRAMIDIETLGTSVESVVLSIGAVQFDETGVLPNNMHAALELGVQFQNRAISEDTFLWWLKQSDAARTAMADLRQSVMTIPLAHRLLSNLTYNCEEVWVRGPHFDIAILGHLFAQYGLPEPWKYNAVRDSRTLLSLVPKTALPFRTQTAHDALADADYEAQCVIAALQLNEKRCAAYALAHAPPYPAADVVTAPFDGRRPVDPPGW